MTKIFYCVFLLNQKFRCNWKNWKMCKMVKKGRRPWGKNQKDTIQYGSKPVFWKLIIFQSTVEKKKTEIKTNISLFLADMHTSLALTFFPRSLPCSKLDSLPPHSLKIRKLERWEILVTTKEWDGCGKGRHKKNCFFYF